MQDSTERSTVGEVGGLLADLLADISGRLARFEPVTQAELDAYHDRKEALLDRIDEETLL